MGGKDSMMNQHFTYQDVLNHSKDFVHALMNRDIIMFQYLLDDDFVWIGDYTNQYISGKEAFIHVLKNVEVSGQLHISHEEYTLLTQEEKTWVVYGRFCATATLPTTKVISTIIHFTFIWQLNKQQKLHLIHAQACHVNTPASNNEQKKKLYFYKNGTSAHEDTIRLENPMNKIRIKDMHHQLHFLSPMEILYIVSNNKLCTIYTAEESFVTRMTLREFDHPLFLRIHRSYLVNRHYIKQIHRYCATLSNGTKLPIGKQRYMELQMQLWKEN